MASQILIFIVMFLATTTIIINITSLNHFGYSVEVPAAEEVFRRCLSSYRVIIIVIIIIIATFMFVHQQHQINLLLIIITILVKTAEPQDHQQLELLSQE